MSDIDAQIDAWLAERERVRSALLAEKEALLAKMAALRSDERHIDEALLTIDMTLIGGEPLSIPAMILRVLPANGGAMSAYQVADAVRRLAPTTDGQNVRSALYKLNKAGIIAVYGERGSMRYGRVTASHGA